MVAARGQRLLRALGDVPMAQAEVTGWKAPSRIVPRKSAGPGVSVSGLARGSPEADGEAFRAGRLIRGLCFLLARWTGASWDEGEVPGVWWERLVPICFWVLWSVCPSVRGGVGQAGKTPSHFSLSAKVKDTLLPREFIPLSFGVSFPLATLKSP